MSENDACGGGREQSTVAVGSDRKAVAWWIEESHGEADVCFDLEDGRTIAIRITDASYGGVVE